MARKGGGGARGKGGGAKGKGGGGGGGRKYVRDNNGRFASTGTGATARGGRLKTAAGNKRATQTMQAGGRAGVIGKPAGLKSGAIRSKVAPAAKFKRTGEKIAFTRVYHGTGTNAAASIKKEGYRESTRSVYGKGVYASRDKSVAKRYASGAMRAAGEKRAQGDKGRVLTHRVFKGKFTRVNEPSPKAIPRMSTAQYAIAGVNVKNRAESVARSGRVARINDPQKVALMSAATANRTLIRSTGTIRRRRPKRS